MYLKVRSAVLQNRKLLIIFFRSISQCLQVNGKLGRVYYIVTNTTLRGQVVMAAAISGASARSKAKGKVNPEMAAQ
jgi:hypothetical protein